MNNPFYIYNQRKYLGYVYDPRDHLFHHCDRHLLHKFSTTPIIINKDISKILDISNDKLPLENGKIIIPSSKTIRDRDHDDYFTYYLRSPSENLNVKEYIKELLPHPLHYRMLHSFIMSSLIKYTPHKYLIVDGSDIGVKQLFNLLSKLDPIIKYCRPSLYHEAYVNKIAFDDIYQSRIVLCDINDKTLRFASLPPEKQYNKPIQYHGIIHKTNTTGINRDNIINVMSVKEEINFTSADVLGWILYHN